MKLRLMIGASLALFLAGCASDRPGEEDIRKVIQGELERQAGLTPGARMELKDLKGFKTSCTQGTTPDTSELYACTLGGTMAVRGYVDDKPTTDEDKEAPLKGVMSFTKNANGEWALVSWEGA